MKTLTKQSPRSVPETCLLAALHDAQGDPVSGVELLKTSNDPMAIRFLAAMLDKRGAFDDAITALSKLAGTEEGRKAGYFKELSELQQRGGKTAEALATVERWRQIAPGDKAAWIASSRLLKDTGKADQAVKIARQAVSKFEGDADLTAGLATLQEDASQWAEAEAIYWRLYDEAASPSDQARWAGQLARLAVRTGRLSELAEKLQERARGNRRSLGPILAQAELQRVIGDEDKRRDLIAEAVRLQPKDVDLRLQLSSLEEQAGNPDRALAVLEEIAPSDPSGKARGALAQAYIRQGQALKGLRELKQLAGKSRDPRAVESSAISLADAKLFEESIAFIQEETMDTGDWRLRYLLGALLEEDGRDQEAVAVFLPLLEAKGELATKLPTTASRSSRSRSGMWETTQEGEVLGDLVSLIESAYAHHDSRSSRSSAFVSGGQSSGSGFTLPDDSDQVRILAMVHLQNLAARVAGGESIRASVKGAAGADADFVNALISASTEGTAGIARAMARFPNHPGVVEWVISSGEATPEMMKSLLDHASDVEGWIKFVAGMQGMRNGPYGGGNQEVSPDDEEASWSLLFSGMKDVINSKDVSKLPQMTWMVVQMAGVNGKISEEHKTTAKELIKQAIDRLSKEPHTPEIGVAGDAGA
ncbi:MAG: hypothetical protein QM755_06675 [Luteolibacter sp.]